MKAYLLEIEKHSEDITADWAIGQANLRGAWAATDTEQLWRALANLTVDEPRKIIEATPDDGWNAWRRLCQHFNPSLASMEGRAWSDLGTMAQNIAKSPEETKKMINELSLRIKHVEDISGEKVADTHAKSILLIFMDSITRQHTASYHGKTNDYSRLKQECLQFINNASGSGFSPMQLGSFVPSQGAPAQPEQWPQDSQSSGVGQGEWGEGYLHALGKSCYSCGQKGHFSRECPAKGKGKSKGKGEFNKDFEFNKGFGKWKSKGFGKGDFGKGYTKGKANGNGGPAKGCWTCGGPHYADQCPVAGSARTLGDWWPGQSDQETGEIKRLSMLKIVKSPMFEHPNSFSALTEEVEQPLESLNVLSKHKLEKFIVANSSESEADDLEQFVSKMEYGGVQPGCDNIEPPGLMSSADVSDKDAEDEYIPRSIGKRSKKRMVSTKFQRVEVPFQNPNISNTSGDSGEVHDSVQANQNERQSKSIEELWDEIVEKQKIHPNDPVQIRTELNVKRFKSGIWSAMDSGKF